MSQYALVVLFEEIRRRTGLWLWVECRTAIPGERMSDSSARTSSPTRKPVAVVAIILALVLVGLLLDSGSVELLSFSVPAWLVAIAGYFLGLVAGWGYFKK
jgi:hypothetical protein